MADNRKRVKTRNWAKPHTHTTIKISESENIPLGDGFLIATALQHSKPIIVTNDSHIIKTAAKYGLITENPIPNDIKEKLSHWKNE
jgi:rRNA-processing protein FCF1